MGEPLCTEWAREPQTWVRVGRCARWQPGPRRKHAPGAPGCARPRCGVCSRAGRPAERFPVSVVAKAAAWIRGVKAGTCYRLGRYAPLLARSATSSPLASRQSSARDARAEDARDAGDLLPYSLLGHARAFALQTAPIAALRGRTRTRRVLAASRQPVCSCCPRSSPRDEHAHIWQALAFLSASRW